MTELHIIDDNENNNDFHFKEYFHQIVTDDNQNIFDIERDNEPHFSVDYTECISANLAS